ncbi:MAG TPA: hypothetical protein DEV75_11870 [Desulfovibrio sp.]|jgi:DNA-binding MarR family transcriptional regulator|nr:hypothetical protein [Desulfovibrio sp.]
MRTDAMDAVRAALRSFCPTGKESVTTPQLAEALGLTTESQRQLLRRRLHALMERGEVDKPDRGLWRLVPGVEPRRTGESYVRMWRAIRIQTAGWRLADIAIIARVERTTVGRYVRWLEAEGYIARNGQDGNANLWRLTAAGRERRETPWPPIDLPMAYEAERRATAQLCRILLLEDPDVPATRRRIQQQLAVLVARFPITTTANGADAPPATEA